ncbi:MAG: PhnA domain-containing protein [Gemmobacter sp.]|jgi:protein PhnA|nr:PhnA domain-containing protein [Gemmobacter sp.]
MADTELIARAGGACEFCGATTDLEAQEVAPAGPALLCAACRGEAAVAMDHWRCLEGAAWSAEPAVQLAVWRKLTELADPWAIETRDAMTLLPGVEGWTRIAGAVEHRDSNGVLLASGDTVTLIKDLPVKGAGFTAKRGTAVRGISLVPDNPGQIEGRVEGQRIVILTGFVKKR